MLKVQVVDLEKASKLLRSESWDVLISIGDVGSPFPSGFKGVDKKLRLEFDDVDTSLLNYLEPNDVVPNKEHIQELIDFVTPLKDMTGHCLIHCFAGVSRSPAASFISHCIWMGPGKEDEAMEAALNGCVNHWIFPNDLMVQMADEMLERHGAMNRCLHKNAQSNYRMY